MKTLFLSPDYRCNEKCIFCPCAENARQYSSLTIKELYEAIDEATDKAGIEMVLISGGEPTLYKEILPLIEYIKSKELRLGILSNSLRFSEPHYVDEFIAVAGSDFELTTAFHSPIGAQHDRITSVPGSFGKSLQGVKNLMNKGVRITVKHIINNLTYKELPDYADWLHHTFPEDIPWVICNMDLCGIALSHKEYTGVPFDVSRPYLEQALDKVTGYGHKRVVRIFNTPLCCIDPYYWPFLQKYESEEEMTALYLPYEKKEDNGIRFHLKGDGGANFAPCKECLFQTRCPGTWKRTAEVYGEKLFKLFK